MESRTNELSFQFFSRVPIQWYTALGSIKAYMSVTHPNHPVGREEAKKSQNRYWIASNGLAAEPGQRDFDGRSFNINCGFSADGNVFFIAVCSVVVVMKWSLCCL